MTNSVDLNRISVHRSVHRLGVRTRCRFSYERTDERTNEEITHVRHKSSPSLTRAHVQNRIDLEVEK